MGYIQDLEKEFRTLLKEGDEEKIVKFVKDKVLQSYRNGIKDGESGKDKQNGGK